MDSACGGSDDKQSTNNILLDKEELGNKELEEDDKGKVIKLTEVDEEKHEETRNFVYNVEQEKLAKDNIISKKDSPELHKEIERNIINVRSNNDNNREEEKNNNNDDVSSSSLVLEDNNNNNNDNICNAEKNNNNNEEEEEQQKSSILFPTKNKKKFKLPPPLPPEKCPLLCCFYAEFDNIVGPKIAYQSPPNFMNLSMDVTLDEIHKLLNDAFIDATATNDEKNEEEDDRMQTTPKTNNNKKDDRDENQHDVVASEESSTTVSSSSTIFDSVCEYIITGNELAGKIISLSTHNFHIVTRPTMISNSKRYERNSLFFCVGFILRQSEDPRPFRPILSRWADALMKLEVDHQFLSSTSTPSSSSSSSSVVLQKDSNNNDNNSGNNNIQRHQKLQSILQNMLIQLNTSTGECNLVLSQEETALNLKLFRPPRSIAPPVADHVVPILLRNKDWQIQMFDWDLAINWVVYNIDGISHAKAMSYTSEVDLEMVQACLRVLYHHKVVALVDMFFYSNHYEPTGKKIEGKLLQDALDYVCKQHQRRHNSNISNNNNNNNSCSNTIVDDSSENNDLQQQQQQQRRQQGESINSNTDDYDDNNNNNDNPTITKLKCAIVELYLSFDRSQTIADVLCEKVASKTIVTPGTTTTTTTTTPTTNYWRYIIADFLDHRRFITFGVIHGLLQRIHNYPFYTSSNNGSNNINNKKNHYQSSKILKIQLLAYQIAEKMDGRTCDDALVSQFERPVEELIAMVQNIGNVVNIFAA